MSRCPPASGTPFITQPRAKKKSRRPTEEGRPKQNLLVHPRSPPHRQADAILPPASSALERASKLIDAKHAHDHQRNNIMSLGQFNIVDSTLREGEQFAESDFSSEDKVEIGTRGKTPGTLKPLAVRRNSRRVVRSLNSCGKYRYRQA